jgi:hypothetical protein
MIKLLDMPDEVVECIMLQCDPYAAMAMIQTCKYLDTRFNNEGFWKIYSEPLRRRHSSLGQDIDYIKEDSYLEYVTARALSLS